MKLRFLHLFIFLVSGISMASAQYVETLHPPTNTISQRIANTRRAEIKSPVPVKLDPKVLALQPDWNVTLSQHGVNHASNIPQNRMDSIKREGRLLMLKRDSLYSGIIDEEVKSHSRLSITPSINTSFKGNKFNNWAPPDNNLAVSDAGFLVSVINSSVAFLDINGNVIFEKNFDDFLSFLNLPGGYFDPKVLYDPETDKFILVVLNGNTPATSKIVVCFSTSGDPDGFWWVYAYSGDPAGQNLWTDYPSIGISTDDLYISGNQYTADRQFSQVLIMQIEKGPGFEGGSPHAINFYDIRDAYGFNDFTVMPLSFGFDGSVGPGIYMISTDITGGSEAMMYYTDANTFNDPHLYVYNATITNYYTPYSGSMLGTNDGLNTNDCRSQTGFYADGTIHFAFNTRGDDFHTKVYYCRLNTADLTSTSIQIGLQPYEYAYPCIAPFSNSVTDRTTLIGFLRTSSTIYPEIRTIVVDNDMNNDGSILVKAGTNFENFDAGASERWGDYSGISKRHSANGPEVWISGCYGTDDNGTANVLSTWIAQVTDGQIAGAPVANFTADDNNIIEGQAIHFSDLSSNQPTSWTWTFPGGTPGNSNQQHPVVSYNQEGIYDVTLTATNAIGNDVEPKVGYIIVTPIVQPPSANFISDVTHVTEGGTVRFQDLTTNNPNKWQWFFPGGTPSLSGEQNPVIVYTEEGCHNVTLDVWNAAGGDVITKTCYIDVLTAVTEADTFFNKFILFPNPVSNGNLNIEFEIEHPTELDFMIVDEQGRLVRDLVHRIVKRGLNDLVFNTDPLAAGLYYLVVHDKNNSMIKSEIFMVTR